MAKLTPLKSLKLVAIEQPKITITVPPELEGKFSRDEWKVFGHFCNTNPELDKLKVPTFLENVAKCIEATAHGKLDDVIKDPLHMTSHPMYKKWQAYYQNLKDEKKAFDKTPEGAKIKDARKEENARRKEKYGCAIVDGVSQPLQSWTLEVEGIFPGRPGSPDQGLWKEAVDPAEVVVNTTDKVPVLIVDGQEQQYNFKKSWNPEYHYAAVYPVRVGIPGQKPFSVTRKKIMFGAASDIKKEGQKIKYASSANLMEHAEEILDKITTDLQKNANPTAAACYLLFKKGIRIGSKKVTKNGTKGLLTLEFGKDVTAKGKELHFDFYGKDSVHDVSTVTINDPDIIKNIVQAWKSSGKLKCTKKGIKEYVLSVAPTSNYTPKLSRTVVAAGTMQDALEEVIVKYNLTKDSSEGLKKLAFNEANMAVAKRLNHQKGVNKAAEAKRKAKFAEANENFKEREKKAQELEVKRLAKIAAYKVKGGCEDKIEKTEAMIAKSKARLELTRMNNSFKEENQNFVTTTSKSAYIDPHIIKTFCDRVDLPIEKVYSKAQVVAFSDFM